jgi:catecholate siderophore receptor
LASFEVIGKSGTRWLATAISAVCCVGIIQVNAEEGARQETASPQEKAAPQPKAQPAMTTLPPIEVKGKRVRPKQVRRVPVRPRPVPVMAEPSPTDSGPMGQGAGTAAGTGYRATESSLSRLPTPLVNTPQTVNVVTRQVIEEQSTATVRDALRNVAGVTFRAGEGGNQGDTPYIRGFQSNNDIFRDGIRDPGWYTRDTFAIDAVEVYKGPASILFGRGSTGGVVNLVSRTAADRNFTDIQITGNTGPGARSQIDTNRVVNENVAVRLIAMGQLYDIAGRDHVEENRWGVAPSAKIKVNDQTTATFSLIHQQDRSIPDYGIPFLSPAWGIPRSPAPVARDTWYGILSGPYPDTERVRADVATAKIEHDFNNNLKLTNTTRYTNVDRLQRNVFPEPNASVPPPPDLNQNWTPNRAQVAVTNTLLANQTDVRATFDTGPLNHTIATGLDLIRETRDFTRNNFAGMGAANFLNPDPWRAGGTPLPPTANQLTNGVSENIGVFVADQVKINKYFELLGAIRYDQFSFTQDAPVADPSVRHLEHTDRITSWRAGGVLHPWERASLYLMHGTSFNPTADGLTISVTTPATALSQIALGPERTETTELGFKTEALNGRLALATAIFETEKTNLRVPDPANSTVTVLAGVVRVRGFEASAVGKITDEWAVVASYTHIDAKIVKTSVAAQLNNAPQNTPEDTLSIWTTYDVNPRWQVGAGAFYNSSAWGDLPNTALIPAYWRFDAMTAYKINNVLTAQFNVYNLTDKYYAASAYSNWLVPGPSRTFALTLRARY